MELCVVRLLEHDAEAQSIAKDPVNAPCPIPFPPTPPTAEASLSRARQDKPMRRSPTQRAQSLSPLSLLSSPIYVLGALFSCEFCVFQAASPGQSRSRLLLAP